MNNIFGKGFEEIGSSDKGLILKSTGNVKIQWGKKFINLLDKDGNINAQIKDIIKSVSSISDVKENGFYIIEDNLYAKVGNKIIEVGSKSGATYVSFLEEQENEGEQKYTALKNIGLVYPKQQNSNKYPTNGIIYFEDSQQLYIVEKGSIKEYQISIPKPYTKQFVISKNSGDSEGAIVIEGAGVDNCLKFDTLKIYSEGQNTTFDFVKELGFNIGKERILTLNSFGIETNNIQSEGADNNHGFRIREISDKYILDIDRINSREPIQVESISNLSKSYGKENVILNTVVEELQPSGTQYTFSLKYKNEYQVGDIIQTSLEAQLEGDNFYTIIPMQFQVSEIVSNKVVATSISYLITETPENSSKLYKTIVDENTTIKRPRYQIVQNSQCYLVSNKDLTLGKLQQADKYNNKENGIISKQNILYSAKFDKEGSGANVFPFYSTELETELESHYNDQAYENVIPTIKVIKRLIAGT